MKSTVSWLGVFFGAVSVALLAQRAFAAGLAPVLQILADYYSSLVQFSLGWAETPINHLLAILTKEWAWHPKLGPDWKNWFVLNLSVNSAYARMLWPATSKTILVSMCSILVAAFNGVTVGLWTGGSNLGDGTPFDQLEYIALPMVVLSMLLLEFVALVLQFGKRSKFAYISVAIFEVQSLLVRFVIVAFGLAFGIFLVASVMLNSHPSDTQTSEVLGYGFTSIVYLSPFLLYAVHFLVGAQTVAYVYNDTQREWRALRAEAGTTVARAIFATYAGAAAFLVLNAGLKLANL